MKLLVLGGTVFLGRHVVEIALDQGHEVTMFNRGQSNSELFPEVEKLQGDRDGNLTALENGKWDAVIDTCGYVPRLVGDSAKLLADKVDHYVFVSSISAYSNFADPALNESSELATMGDESVEEINGETYGPLKVLSENAAEAAMPGRVCHVRAGLIVGPHDKTDRFTYWPVRIDKGGEVLAPQPQELSVQFIDVRDLATWMIKSAEEKIAGHFNVTGPSEKLSMSQFLETCQRVSGSDARFTWAEHDFLLEQEVGYWMDLPMWLGPTHAGMTSVSIDKALNSGLKFRPLEDTIRDTLEWHKTRPSDHKMGAGIDSEKEQAVLSAWKARNG